MPPLGAHMSIAGGFHKAIERGADAGCDCVQIFTTPPRQWPVPSERPSPKTSPPRRKKDIGEEDVRLFQLAIAEFGIRHTLTHASYLINLASPDLELWQKSIDSLVLELERADKFGIPFVVFHPGASMASDGKTKKRLDDISLSPGEEAGLQRIVQAVDEVTARTTHLSSRCLLENTAGQGTNLGWQLEHLGWILDRARAPERLGVCIDTCHAFAAGYAMQTRKDYLATIRRVKQTVGLERVHAFHLNDSKRELGCRVDRHENIGRGEMGLEPFRHLVNDRRFRATPMYLETPKGDHDGESWDQINLGILRELAKKKGPT